MIPLRLDDISAEWLTTALRKASTIPDSASVSEISLNPMGEGVGMMSAMSRIAITYDEEIPGAPSSLVIKLPAENETNRAVAEQFNLYMKEARYYRELRPLTEFPSPDVYLCVFDDDENFLMLMSDASDYRMGNQVSGATLDETELCIDELTKLHASFWNDIEHVEWLPHISNSDNARNMALGAEAGWPRMMEYFGDLVPAAIDDRRDDYLANIANQQEKLDTDPITLIHGDFRMDNMLFGQKPEHQPLLVVDFQGPLKGKGIQDVAYLLSHSTRTEVRQQHEKALIRRYVDGLLKGGVSDYNFETAWEDYRSGVLYCWTVAVVIAGTLDPGNERGFAWMSKMVERNTIALLDLDCLSLF